MDQDSFPPELIQLVINFLPLHDHFVAKFVNREWYHLSKPHPNPSIFQIKNSIISNHCSLDLMKFINDLFITKKWNNSDMHLASQSNNLTAVKFLRSFSPPVSWCGMECIYFAQHGNIEALAWVRSQTPPAPWDETTCFTAAKFNQLDTLKWLRSQDPPCKWELSTTAIAVEKGFTEIVKFLAAQRPPCPINEETYQSLQKWSIITFRCPQWSFSLDNSDPEIKNPYPIFYKCTFGTGFDNFE